MLKIILIIFVFSNLAISSTQKCELNFKKLSICGNVKFLVEPNRKNSSDFTLKLNKKGDKKTELDQNISIEPRLWMKMKSGHEHGSEDVVVKKRKDEYLITNVWFLMLGKWQLIVDLKKDGKVVDSATMDVMVERKVK